MAAARHDDRSAQRDGADSRRRLGRARRVLGACARYGLRRQPGCPRPVVRRGVQTAGRSAHSCHLSALPVRLTAAFTRLELTSACVTVSRPRVVRDRRTRRTRIVRRKVKVCPRLARAAGATPKKVVSRTREVFGVLTDTTGRALAGRDVHVQTQPKAVGAAWQTVRVGADRRGRGRSEPSCASSRRFVSGWSRRATRATTTGTSATLTTNVAARSTIRADRTRLRNGEVVRLSGRVQGGHIPSGGMQIALYGFSPSKRRWLPVRTTVRVDPRGNWASVYRFTSTGVRATYRFRVRIAERATFPFSTGYSRTVRVTVRP